MNIKPIASGSAGNAYLVSDGHSVILLDAGVPITRIQEAMRYKTSQLTACLITHRHGDHTKGLQKLSQMAVDTYMPEDTLEAQGDKRRHTMHCVAPGDSLELGSWRIKAFDVKHDVPCLGYLGYSTVTGETFCYITDAQYSPYRFKGVTHWIVEANFSQELTRRNVEDGTISQEYKNRVWHTHMSIENLQALLESNDLTATKQIYLCHMSEKNADEAQFIDRIRKQTGAEVYAC